MEDDPFHLQRFVDAQTPFFERVLAELRAGRKVGHWMWFVFPQLRGLGQSAMARTFGIASAAEAAAYLAHPLLGSRLIECTKLVNRVDGRTIQEIFGYPDELKFRSCMTLFARVAGSANGQPFVEALEKYFGGELDPLTLQSL